LSAHIGYEADGVLVRWLGYVDRGRKDRSGATVSSIILISYVYGLFSMSAGVVKGDDIKIA